jgi:two-component system sensor histidine kinase HydH
MEIAGKCGGPSMSRADYGRKTLLSIAPSVLMIEACETTAAIRSMWTKGKGMDRSRKIKLIAGAIVVISVVHYLYLFPVRMSVTRELVSRAYFFPIILAALWFGLRGGLLAPAIVSVICLPYSIIAMGQHRVFFYDEILQLFLFILVGAILGILKDREQRQRTLNESLQALAALGESMASVAHEMKNILIPVRGFLRRVQENPSLDKKAASYLEIVDTESAKLDKMTQDMLAFGRFAPLQRKAVEVSEFVEEVKRVLHHEFRDSSVRLVCECECRTKVSLDAEKIRQALINLLQNALQASPEGGEVRLSVDCDGRAVKFVVEDQGVGIPSANLDRIFHPFFTTKAQGTGLGLAITQRIVREHGGRIQVKSVPGNGTRFTLAFPISEETAASAIPEKTGTQAFREAADPQVGGGDENGSIHENIEKPNPIF